MEFSYQLYYRVGIDKMTKLWYNIYKSVSIVLLMISLSGCISLNPFSDDGGIKVDAQIGKTNEKVTGVKADEFSLVNKTNNAETVVEDSKIGTITATAVNITEQVPFWIWFIAILGWLLPSPTDIYIGLGKLLINIKRYIKE